MELRPTNTGRELDGVLYRAIFGMIYPRGKGDGRGIFVFCCGLGLVGVFRVLHGARGEDGGRWGWLVEFKSKIIYIPLSEGAKIRLKDLFCTD